MIVAEAAKISREARVVAALSEARDVEALKVAKSLETSREAKACQHQVKQTGNIEGEETL